MLSTATWNWTHAKGQKNTTPILSCQPPKNLLLAVFTALSSLPGTTPEQLGLCDALFFFFGVYCSLWRAAKSKHLPCPSLFDLSLLPQAILFLLHPNGAPHIALVAFVRSLLTGRVITLHSIHRGALGRRTRLGRFVDDGLFLEDLALGREHQFRRHLEGLALLRFLEALHDMCRMLFGKNGSLG